MMQKSFRNLTELLNRLYLDKKLLAEMFYHRQQIDFTRDDAFEYTDAGRLAFLIDHGVIREEGDSLELEEFCLQFFEEVLLANEEITGSAVADQIELLKENINFYLLERENPTRQMKYLRKVKRNLRNIAQLSGRKVIDLKRNINDTFKQQPNYQIKRERLKKFLAAIREINRLVNTTEQLLDDRSSTFEHFAPDNQLSSIILSVRIELSEVCHTLIEQQSVIRDYLHRIDRQDRLIKKIRRLKMLKDQFVWTTSTDILPLLETKNDIFLETLSASPLKPSLPYLRNTDTGSQILGEARKLISKSMKRDTADAPALGLTDFSTSPIETEYVDIDQLADEFLSSGNDLFAFVVHYPFDREKTLSQKLVYYSNVLQRLIGKVDFSDEWREFEEISYPLITATK